MRLAALAVVVVSFAYLGFLGTMLSNLELTAPASDTIVRALRLLALVVLPIGALVALWNLGVVWGGRRRWTAKLWALVLAAGLPVDPVGRRRVQHDGLHRELLSHPWCRATDGGAAIPWPTRRAA